MRRLHVTAICGLLLAAAPAAIPADEELKGDLAKIQGKWKGMVGRERNIPLVMEVKKDKVTLLATRPADGQEITLKGQIRLSETASPKQWDWYHFQGPDGQDIPDNLAIYELKGDALKICSGGPNNPRPSEFKPGEDGPPNLIELKRAKDDSKKDGN